MLKRIRMKVNPLLLAVLNGNDDEFIRLAIQSSTTSLEVIDPSGRTLLMNAVLFGVPKSEKWLLEHGVQLNNRCKKGWTALHYGAYVNRVSSIRSLITFGLPVDGLDNFGNTALWRAVFEENLDAVKELMKYDSDPTLKNYYDISPLDFAKQIESRSLIRALNTREDF